jgi:predicted DNA-binding protein YlxM (UPF0122 family)
MEATIAAALTTDRARAMRTLADHLRAQGDAVCEALKKTEQQLEDATKKLEKTEKQLEAAKEVDEEAQAEATKNGLFDELVKALATYTGVEAAVRPSCAAASFSLSRARAHSLSVCDRL